MSSPPPVSDPERPAPPRAKRVRNVVIGLIVAVCGVGVLLVMGLVRVMHAFDTSRSLADFETPAEARAFTSAHLPTPLPNDAVVETLAYDHWTDWILDARVRLPTSDAADRYLERAKRDRKLNDAYCFAQEPSDGARYFLAGVSACGLVRRVAPAVIEVHCNTR